MSTEELVKVIFLGGSDPREKTGEIKLADGPNGEPRKLSVGGDPSDALITQAELHMLTSKFAIKVCEEQPELTDEDVEAQTPLDSTADAGGVPVTLPLDEDGNPIPAPDPDLPQASDDPGTPSDPSIAPQPSEPGTPTPGDGVSAPADPSTPASPPEPITPTPGQ